MKSWKSFGLILIVTIILTLSLTTTALRASQNRRGGSRDNDGNSGIDRRGTRDNTGDSGRWNDNRRGDRNDDRRGDRNDDRRGDRNDRDRDGNRRGRNGRGRDNFHNHRYPYYSGHPSVLPVTYGLAWNQDGAEFCNQYPAGVFCPQVAIENSCVCYQDGTCSNQAWTNACVQCQQPGVISVKENYICQPY